MDKFNLTDTHWGVDKYSHWEEYNKTTAKEKLANSSYPVCKDIADKIAIAEDNSEKLDLFIKRQDYIRKINI